MRILEVRLNGFGKFDNLILNFPSNFKVIVGRNEAGKTTVVDAISGILFGFRRGQKNLRERYQPWKEPERFTASMTLVREDGTRFLVGRDFFHDRLELFRRRGVKLESLPESELDRILQEELGLNTPQLFESTLLIRQPEVSMVAKDRMAISRIAEALGRKISGSDDNATAAQALESIRLKMEQINAASGPGSLAELSATVAERERDLAQIEQGYRRYAALVEERDRLKSSLTLVETDLLDLAGRIESGKSALLRSETRTRLTAELAEVERVLGAWNEQEQELVKVQREKADLRAIKIDETTLGRAEDLANQLATLEVERRYEEEAVKQFQAETDLLEQEIAATKAKMAALDGQALDLEVQDRLALLIPQVNENTARLGELFPEIDRLTDKLRRAKIMRLTGIILSLIASAGVFAAYRYLTRLEFFGAAGVAGLCWLWTLINLARAGGLRKAIKRLNNEIERRDLDLKERRRQVELLLQGKTTAQFQAELETSRLHRNDLWHLENAPGAEARTVGAAKEPGGSGVPGETLGGTRHSPYRSLLPRSRGTPRAGRPVE